MNEEINTLKELFLDMQKIINKTSETIQTMYEVIIDVSDRVEKLEEKK